MLKHARGVVELVVYFEGLGVVRKARGIFDVKDVVTETLEADDVVEVLPDDAGDGAAAHKAHHYDSFLFHEAEV
jgi:hypothetical protein